jgi:hypothetical protein
MTQDSLVGLDYNRYNYYIPPHQRTATAQEQPVGPHFVRRRSGFIAQAGSPKEKRHGESVGKWSSGMVGKTTLL